MDNPVHILLEPPEANLVAGIKWVMGSTTQRFNLHHRLVGHLFQGRYKAIPVSSEFKEELLGRMENALAGRNRESHSGEAKRAYDELEAERLVAGGL